MPRIKLQKREVDKIQPPAGKTSETYFDINLKGFAMRVSQKGKKVFFVQKDMPTGGGGFKTVSEKIGEYGENLTVDQARILASEKLKNLSSGKPLKAKTPTLLEMYKRYVEDKKIKENTAQNWRVYFEGSRAKFNDWLNVEMHVLAANLTPETIIDRHRQVLDSSGPGAALNSFKMLLALFNYSMILYPNEIFKNPVKVLSSAGLWPKSQPRETYLEPSQFKLFKAALQGFHAVHRDCYLFSLFQGLRPDEAHSLRWQDVDLEKATFDLSYKTSTTKHRGLLPLSRQSLEILTRRLAGRQEGDIWVFESYTAGRSKSGHITLRADKLRQKTGLDITPHSLRRTFSTIGERLKLRREDINLLTNHVDSSVLGRHYLVLGVEDLRDPLQAICDEIERLLNL